MSLRAALLKLWQNGRILVRTYRAHRPDFVPLKSSPTLNISSPSAPGGRPSLSPSSTNSIAFFQSSYNAARRILIDNVLRRATNSLSDELRKRTTRQLLYGGNSAPFFAFVGVSLASGTGLITKDNELDVICREIREALYQMQASAFKAETDIFEPGEEIDLGKFTIGPNIAKGSNAVIYAARKTPPNELLDKSEDGLPRVASEEPLGNFPFALKMMFNYDAESNAMSILRSMHREIVPAQLDVSRFSQVDELQQSLGELVQLPPHPNLVTMHFVFAAPVPSLPGSLSLYPQALPARLNPQSGYGRNMSLFLLMKRYDESLKDYLAKGVPEVREGILLFTQLLEGVAHINRHGVAHRDLKSDNLLVELSEEEDVPLLVVSDFGCCLAEPGSGLTMPYRSRDVDRGGNIALMAPEVVTAEPSLFTAIDYSKADGWAAATIAYEIFGADNPFYRTPRQESPLRSATYREQELPPLPPQVPALIARLVQHLLARSPNKRPSGEWAATVCQLYLWAPSGWMKGEGSPPSSSEILQWLLTLTTKVLCTRASLSIGPGRHRSFLEYQVIASFLRRAHLPTIRSALAWIHQ